MNTLHDGEANKSQSGLMYKESGTELALTDRHFPVHLALILLLPDWCVQFGCSRLNNGRGFTRKYALYRMMQEAYLHLSKGIN